jgi:hypothetical protein
MLLDDDTFRLDIVAVGASHPERMPSVDDLDIRRVHDDRDEIRPGWGHARLVAIEHDRAHQHPARVMDRARQRTTPRDSIPTRHFLSPVGRGERRHK